MPRGNCSVHRSIGGIAFGILLTGLLLAAGCGSPNVPVSGKVVVKGGIPLGEGSLVLMPDPPDKTRQPPGALIGPDGSFVCYSNAGGNGILPGKYRVVITFASGMGSGESPMASAFKKYTQEATTDLSIDVPSGGKSDIVLEVEEAQETPEASPKGGES